MKSEEIRDCITLISELPLYFNFTSAIHIAEIIEYIRNSVEYQHVKVVYN